MSKYERRGEGNEGSYPSEFDRNVYSFPGKVSEIYTTVFSFLNIYFFKDTVDAALQELSAFLSYEDSDVTVAIQGLNSKNEDMQSLKNKIDRLKTGEVNIYKSDPIFPISFKNAHESLGKPISEDDFNLSVCAYTTLQQIKSPNVERFSDYSYIRDNKFPDPRHVKLFYEMRQYSRFASWVNVQDLLTIGNQPIFAIVDQEYRDIFKPVFCLPSPRIVERYKKNRVGVI